MQSPFILSSHPPWKSQHVAYQSYPTNSPFFFFSLGVRSCSNISKNSMCNFDRHLLPLWVPPLFFFISHLWNSFLASLKGLLNVTHRKCINRNIYITQWWAVPIVQQILFPTMSDIINTMVIIIILKWLMLLKKQWNVIIHLIQKGIVTMMIHLERSI